MNYTCYKLAVFDLDGTLVEYGSENVTPAILETVKMLHENGVMITIATGRSWKQTKAIADILQIHAPVIVQSGAIIIDPVTEKVLKQQPLGADIEINLHGLVNSSQVDQFCLSEIGVYFATKASTSGGKWLLGNGEDCRIAAIDTKRHSVIKHLFIGAEGELRRLAKTIEEFNPAPLTILWPPDQLTEDWFLEVFDPLASKGQALRWLAERLELNLNEIIAFGDGHNDLDMLQAAGFGVAMQGSPQELLDNADLVIPGATEEGIARLFRGEPVGLRIKAS